MNEAEDNEDDWPVIDGDSIRGTFSSCAAKVSLNPIRFLRFSSEISFFRALWLGFFVLTILAFVFQWWITGGLLLIPTAALSYLLWWICRHMAVTFQNAALTPGMIVSTAPLEFIALANMSTGVGPDAYAVKRIAIPRLPCHPNQIGVMFPCVSGFHGDRKDRWDDFDPRPLSIGTGNINIIEDRRKKLGAESFDQLKDTFDQKQYPEKAGELFWIIDPNEPDSPPPLPPSQAR